MLRELEEDKVTAPTYYYRHTSELIYGPSEPSYNDPDHLAERDNFPVGTLLRHCQSVIMIKAAYQPPAYDGCQLALFEWAESYDSKDWDRLAKCIFMSHSSLRRVAGLDMDLHGLCEHTESINYSSVMGQEWEAMAAADFVALASSADFLGNARIRIPEGGSEWKFAGLEPDIRWKEHDVVGSFTSSYYEK
ncbi:Scytalone dehydratase [Penicillium freii]|nr:Scytalone dehydratase [Penicillium freii]